MGKNFRKFRDEYDDDDYYDKQSKRKNEYRRNLRKDKDSRRFPDDDESYDESYY